MAGPVTTHWLDWHREYDDPQSSLSRRRRVVQRHLHRAIDERAGRPADLGLISLCAGDGRDVLRVLASSDAGRRTRALLVELDPTLAERARTAAAELGLDGVDVRTADAGAAAVYAAHAPADVVLACGVFGNVAAEDAIATIAALPALVADGGTVIWTRGRPGDGTEPSTELRAAFGRHGFTEVAFTAPDDARFRVGVHRRGYAPAGPLPARLFTFD